MAVALRPDGAILHVTLRCYLPGGDEATLLAGDSEPGYVDSPGVKARFNGPVR